MKFACSLFLVLCLTTVSWSQWIQTDGPYESIQVDKIIENDDVLIASTWSGVFYRNDLSSRWTWLSQHSVNDYTVNGDTLYYSNYGIFQILFSSVASGPIEVYSFSLDGLDRYGDNFYLGSDYAGFFYLNDNTQTGSSHNDGLPGIWGQSVMEFNVDHIDHNDSYILASTWGGMYRNTHNLGTWEEKNSGLSIGSIQFVKNVSDTFYISIDQNLYYSADFGDNWNLQYTAPSSIKSFSKEGNAIYLGTESSGVYCSMDNGSNWTALNSGLISQNVTSISNYNDTLVCVNDEGFNKYINGVWELDNNGMITSSVSSLTSTSNTVYACNYSDVLSLNNDDTWEVVSTSSPIDDYYEVKESNDTLFLSATDPVTNAPSTLKHILYSTDAGNSWLSVPNPPFVGDDSYRIEYDNGVLYAHENDRLFATSDLGSTWEELPFSSAYCNQVVDFQSVNSVQFAAMCGDGDLLKLDEFQNWQESLSGNFLYLEPSFVGHCDGAWFVYFPGYGVAVSMDEGGTWSYASNGLGTDKFIADYVSYGQQIFLATWSGVYTSVDYGQNWYSMNVQLTNTDVRSITVFDDTLYAGTNGNGVWKAGIQDLNQYLGLSEITVQESEMIVFPNPSNGAFTINLKDLHDQKVQIIVHSLSGREVFVDFYDASSIELKLDLTPGIYLLTAQNQGFSKTFKLRIE